MERMFDLQRKKQAKDGIGGFSERWETVSTVNGYLDLLSGTNAATGAQNAVTEDSTHILIVQPYRADITDEMRISEPDGKRKYLITYADNPVGANHHNEIYLKLLQEDGEAEADAGKIRSKV